MEISSDINGRKFDYGRLQKVIESTFNMQAKTYDTDKNGKHARTLYQHVINQLETIKFDNLLDVGVVRGKS